MTKNTKHWASIIAGILSLAGYASAASLGSEKYTYDASGNIVEKSIDGKITKVSYDNANRATVKQAIGQSAETINYDSAGRPVTEQNVAGQEIRRMSYGYGDKVLEAQTHGSSTGFYYNAEGQLVGKQTYDTVTTFIWDGDVLAADGAEAFTNEAHITGGVPLLQKGNDIIISDYLGSTLTTGENVFSTTAYGEGLEAGRFTGKPFVKELGGYMFHHRLYSPYTDQWTLSDPSGFPDGPNNRLYVSGDPMSQIDPNGLETVNYNTVLAKNSTSTPNCEVKVKTTSEFEIVPQAVHAELVAGSGTSGYTYDSFGGVTSRIGLRDYKGSTPEATRYEFGLSVTAIASTQSSPVTHIYLSGSADGIDFIGADTRTSWAYEQ